MLRLLHTSDWHLGHMLHDVARTEEHAAFLAWLLDTIEAELVDALLIAGDVFDTANPAADAQHAWYWFVASAKVRCPRLQIVVIAGNHDSAARLEAPDPILRELGVRMVGAVPRRLGDVDPDRLVFPLQDRDGHVAAWVAAVPYLRPSDLPAIQTTATVHAQTESAAASSSAGAGLVEPLAELAGLDAPAESSLGFDPLIEGVRRLYSQVLDVARARCEASHALLAMGHCYMTGARLSEMSERKILGGNLHALPVNLFSPDIAYVALGHLHRPQRVGGEERVRYAGSPMPLAFDESAYRQRICIVDLDGARLASVREIDVPRTVKFIRLPAAGALEPDALIPLLEELEPLDPSLNPTNQSAPAETRLEPWQRPYLEVHVVLSQPDPALRQRIDQALAGKAARLLSLRRDSSGNGLALGDLPHTVSLDELLPEQVFRQCYARSFGGEPDADLLAAFAELVEVAQGGTR